MQVCALTVMPRSRSTSSLSCPASHVSLLVYFSRVWSKKESERTRICLFESLAEIVPVNSSNRSLSVLFPWSICATMQKLRYRSIGMALTLFSSSAGDGFVVAYHLHACGIRIECRNECVGSCESAGWCWLPPQRKSRTHRRLQARPALHARVI